MGLVDWWFTYGWRELVIADYAVALGLAAVWWIVACLRRIHRPAALSSTISSIWFVPVAAWALQAVAAALNSTQLDLTSNVSRVLFTWMYAASSVLAGLAVGAACLAAQLFASRPPRDWGRSRVVILSAVAWAGTAAVWGAVLVRESVFVEGR